MQTLRNQEDRLSISNSIEKKKNQKMLKDMNAAI